MTSPIKHSMLPPQKATSNTPNPNKYAGGVPGIPGVAPTTRVVDVRPPEDEAALMAAQMRDAEAAFAALDASETMPTVMNDQVFAQELKRKEVLSKLVHLRSPMLHEVVIDDMTFVLKAITPVENGFIATKTKDLDMSNRVLQLTLLTVSAALVSVNGIPLEEVYDGPPSITDPFTRRYNQLMQWPSIVIDNLFTSYNDFLNDVQKKYAASFLVQPPTQKKE